MPGALTQARPWGVARVQHVRVARSGHHLQHRQHAPCDTVMRMLTGRCLVLALVLAPAASLRAQIPPRASDQVVLRPGDALKIAVWRHTALTGDSEAAPAT